MLILQKKTIKWKIEQFNGTPERSKKQMCKRCIQQGKSNSGLKSTIKKNNSNNNNKRINEMKDLFF